MPEFDRESGSRRLFDHIEFLRTAGWSVSFVTRNAPSEPRYVRMLQQRGVATYVGFDARLEQLVGAGRFDLALLAFWHVAEAVLPIVRRLSPATRVLVDSIDLHCLRNARGILQRRSDQTAPALLNQRFGSEMVRELNMYVAADGVLTVSQKEADWINDFLGEAGLALPSPDAEEFPASSLTLPERKGILFVGNFRHAPNVNAVEYLFGQIVPCLDPALLAEHPLYVVGNDLDDKIALHARGLPNVHMVGWVPSVEPYLNRARITVVPLLYGAGTKRKLIQALMAGTPTVSTSVGVEGLSLEDGRHVLVADNATAFADAVRRLLTDSQLWTRLAHEGRSHVLSLHGRETTSVRFHKVIEEVLSRPVKRYEATVWVAGPIGADAYEDLVKHVCDQAQSVIPAGAKMLVVGRGDDRLLAVEGREAAHFPQAANGGYAGHHPANSREAIDHLEALRARGNHFLLFPHTAFWWLDHYAEFGGHLNGHYHRVLADENCIIFRLTEAGADNPPSRSLGSREIERLRPVVPDLPGTTSGNGDQPGKRILALGVYLASQPNTVEDVVANLAGSSLHHVTQRWVALLGQPPSEAVARVTARSETRKAPKFELLNDLLRSEDLSAFDYVLLLDDDIVLPDRFLDRFISLQARLDFAIAQPARTSNSYIDHTIVEQQRGVLARQTRFVEIGPVVSFHRSAYGLVFPFDLTSPMGWGYENVWSYRLAQRGLKMGIIDAVPVDHSTRKPVANYGWADADRRRKTYLNKHPHYSLDDCFRVLDAIPLPDAEAVA